MDNEAQLPRNEARIWEIMTLKVFMKELKKVSLIAAPLVAVSLSHYFLQAISVMMAGHLGELALSAVAIANSFCTVSGFSLIWGLSAALETLNGQAYGALEYEKIGTYTFCAIISIIPICIPVCILWIFMDKLLVLIGQDPQVALVARTYSMWLIPALLAYSILQPQVRFLQSQSLVLPLLFTAVATLCLHIIVCWVLVFKTGLGAPGAALAMGVSFWFNVILLGLYMNYSSSCEKTRVKFPSLEEFFSSITEFFRFAVPSAIMICLEWWAFEILVLLSGLLPNPKLETSVLSICFTSAIMHYQIPLGFSSAASTRISNELGAGNPRAAQITSFVGVVLTFAETFIASTILFCCRHVFGNAYSNEKDVVAEVAKIIPLVCLSLIMDGLHGITCGIVRGIGRQHIGAYANFTAYYLFGIPTGILCAFVWHLRGKGLWIGMLTGISLQGIILSFVIAFTDWKKQANMARERIYKQKLAENALVSEEAVIQAGG